MATQPSSPQGIGGVLDTAFQLFKTSFPVVWPISLLMALVGLLPMLYLLFVGMGSIDPQALAQTGGATITNTLIMVVMTVVPSLWCMGALLLKQRAVGSDEPMSTGDAFKESLRRVLPLLLATLLYSVAVLVGSILLIVPGVILMLSLLMYTALLLFEGKGAIESLTGSHRLVWGNWWRAAAVLTVAAILMIVIFIAVSVVVAVATPFIGAASDFFLATMIVQLVLNAAVNVFVTPFTSAVLVALYWDLKLRKEGGDLAARVDALSPA
jgi:hypothetical protein